MHTVELLPLYATTDAASVIPGLDTVKQATASARDCWRASIQIAKVDLTTHLLVCSLFSTVNMGEDYDYGGDDMMGGYDEDWIYVEDEFALAVCSLPRSRLAAGGSMASESVSSARDPCP